MSFAEFAGIRILDWFLAHPSQKIHFKQLCRELALSPLTVKSYCEEFLPCSWLLEERQANLRIFFLNNQHYSVRAMKRAHALEFLRKSGVEKAAGDEAISFALYGSHASGEYDEHSDFDFLLVGRREHADIGKLREFEKTTGKKAQLTIISLDKWETGKRRDPFVFSVLKNHAQLKGAPL